MCTSFVFCHLSWVAVGIMVNPAWGVSILLILSFFCITLFFVINETTHANEFRLSTLFTYKPGFLGRCFIVVPPVLVGQSFYGRETAVSVYVRDQVLARQKCSCFDFRTDNDITPVLARGEIRF